MKNILVFSATLVLFLAGSHAANAQRTYNNNQYDQATALAAPAPSPA